MEDRRHAESETLLLINIISVMGRIVKAFLSQFPSFLWISRPYGGYWPRLARGVRQPGLLLGRRAFLRLWGELVKAR